LAKGDSFVDVYVAVLAGGYVDIRPAVGVEIMIFHIYGYAVAYIIVKGKDSAGNIMDYLLVGLEGGETSAVSVTHTAYIFKRPAKMIITNSEFLTIYNSGTSTNYFAVFGVQTK